MLRSDELRRGIFEWMHSQQAVTREDIEIKILEMVMNAERRAFFAGTLKYNVNSRRSYIRELQSCTDIENLKKWFLDKTREICTKLRIPRKKKLAVLLTEQRNISMKISAGIFLWMMFQER